MQSASIILSTTQGAPLLTADHIAVGDANRATELHDSLTNWPIGICLRGGTEKTFLFWIFPAESDELHETRMDTPPFLDISRSLRLNTAVQTLEARPVLVRTSGIRSTTVAVVSKPFIFALGFGVKISQRYQLRPLTSCMTDC